MKWVKKISKYGGDTAEPGVFFLKIIFWQQLSKITKKQIKNFSASVQFWLVFYFGPDRRRKREFC